MPIGYYKLAQQTAGYGNFASVRLRLERPPLPQDFILSQINRASAAPEWIVAAIVGADDAIRLVGAADKFAVAEIIDFLGADCDTTENGAWCAGYMAALNAMSIDDATPVFDDENRVWRVVRSGNA